MLYRNTIFRRQHENVFSTGHSDKRYAILRANATQFQNEMKIEKKMSATETD